MAVNRKIALIDLDAGHIEIIPVPEEWRQKFIGGRCLGTYLACKHTVPGSDALEAGNALVISAGILAGTLSSPSTITYIISRSPLTGCLECAFLPGLFAAEMRWAGFDHLVITGRVEQPVSLHIHNGGIKIIAADHLKGCGVAETCNRVRQAVGDEDLKILAVGPAGENLVRFATITDAAGHKGGRTGMGAVLGSKGVKALACRGTLDVEIKFPEKVIADRLARTKASTAAPDKQPGRVVSEADELTLRDFSKMPVDRELAPEIKRSLTDSGMDPQAVLYMGARTGNFTGSNPDGGLADLIEHIARRQGAGDVLAEGPLRAFAKDGFNSIDAAPLIKDQIHLYRELPPTCDAGACAPPFAAPKRSSASYRGKPGTVANRALSDRLLDCLGDRTCAGICPATGRLDLARVAALIRLNTGFELKPKDLQTSAYRCYALERLYNLRVAKADRANGSLDSGLDVPGSIKMSTQAWSCIGLKAFRRSVAQYYRQNGWDRQTVVKKKVLEQLGMGELWKILK